MSVQHASLTSTQHMSDSAFSEAASIPREGARSSSAPALAPASAGSWGDMRSSQDSALPCGTPTTGSRVDLVTEDESRACKGAFCCGYLISCHARVIQASALSTPFLTHTRIRRRQRKAERRQRGRDQGRGGLQGRRALELCTRAAELGRQPRCAQAARRPDHVSAF